MSLFSSYHDPVNANVPYCAFLLLFFLNILDESGYPLLGIEVQVGSESRTAGARPAQVYSLEDPAGLFGWGGGAGK